MSLLNWAPRVTEQGKYSQQHVGVFTFRTWNFGIALICGWCPHATIFLGHSPCDFSQQQLHRSQRDVQSGITQNPGEIRRRDDRKVPRHGDYELN